MTKSTKYRLFFPVYNRIVIKLMKTWILPDAPLCFMITTNSFNKQEDEFPTLRDYNDYLEEVETIGKGIKYLKPCEQSFKCLFKKPCTCVFKDLYKARHLLVERIKQG